MAPAILEGCSTSVLIIRSAIWGLVRMSSMAAIISERWLLMSCRSEDSL